MRNKIVPVLLCGVLAAGGCLYLGGTVWSGSFALPQTGGNSAVPSAVSDQPPVAIQPSAAPAQPTETPASGSSVENDGWITCETELQEFHAAEIAVQTSNVRLETGDHYALQYKLPPDETVQQLEVQDGTLYFRTQREERPLRLSDIGSVRYNGTVCITVPRETAFDVFSVDSVSGNITLTGLTCDLISTAATSGNICCDINCNSLTADTTSGDIEVEGAVTDDAHLSSTSGDITFGGNCASLTAALTSGDFTFTGSADQLEACASSGDVTLSGAIRQEAQATVSSGGILVRAADPTLHIEGGEIEVDGVSTEEGTFTRQGGGCTLTLQAGSGEIEVDTR
ncbi:MAG: hypothetical protein DBX91_02650 [Subdoligranulum variabile]|nr:MAG: hypothetical protein DBX91_02650 [Subdoligranulum variabile]